MIEAALAALENDQQRNELAAFYEQYKNRFFSIAYSKLHSSEEAEDALQEAFLRVVDNPNKFLEMSDKERVRFVDGIVRHVSVDKFNRNQKNNVLSVDDIGDDCSLPRKMQKTDKQNTKNKAAKAMPWRLKNGFITPFQL